MENVGERFSLFSLFMSDSCIENMNTLVWMWQEIAESKEIINRYIWHFVCSEMPSMDDDDDAIYADSKT